MLSLKNDTHYVATPRAIERWIKEWMEDHFERLSITTRRMNQAREAIEKDGRVYSYDDVDDILYDLF